MGRLAPIGLRTEPGLSLSCALGRPETHRLCAGGCACECHPAPPGTADPPARTVSVEQLGTVRYVAICDCGWRGGDCHTQDAADYAHTRHRQEKHT